MMATVANIIPAMTTNSTIACPDLEGNRAKAIILPEEWRSIDIYITIIPACLL
jgi:hypothetical protein